MTNRHSPFVPMLALVLTVSSHAHAHDEAVAVALSKMLVNPTHTSVQGTHLRWSNPSTWVGRNVPGHGSTVVIPAGSGVDFDGDTARISWIRVKGRLGISATPLASGALAANGVLNSVAMTIRVETLVVDEGGAMSVGDEANRIGQPVTISFIHSGPIDTTWDAQMLSRGLVSLGHIELWGVEVTPFAFTDGAAVGDRTITLKAPAKGWQPGDRLVIPGLSPTLVDDDESTVASMSADRRQVTLTSPLRYRHPSAPNRPMPVANLTRRITLKSESTSSTAVRGHFMTLSHTDVSYAAFQGLGRSDKLRVATDLPNLGNLRGRYAFHVHKIGIGKGQDPALVVKGAVVEDNPGWGFVNHSSRVEFVDSIAYKVVGSGFTGETGDEVGAFRGSLAMRMTGTGGPSLNANAHRGVADFAFSGHGFWVQGGGIAIEDCIATGTNAGAFVVMGDEFKLPGAPAVLFPVANLVPPGWGARTHVLPSQVPTTFRRNVAFGVVDGLVIWTMGGVGGRQGVPGLGIFEDSYLEASHTPVVLGYSSWQVLRGLTLRGNGKWSQTAVNNTGVNSGYTYENLDIRGFSVGIQNPTNYENRIVGNTIQALTGVFLMNTYQPSGRTLIIDDNQFLDVPAEGIAMASQAVRPYTGSPFQTFQGMRQKDVAAVFDMVFTSLYASGPFGWWTTAFQGPNRRDVPNDHILVDGRYLFLMEYHPGFVTTPLVSLPLEVRRRPNGTPRTSRDLQTELGLYLGNVVIPPDAVAEDRITGLLSHNKRTILPNLTVNRTTAFYQVTDQTSGFMLRVKDAAGKFHTFGPFNLTPGVWNFPMITVDGYRRGVPVFSDPSGGKPPNPW